MTYQQTRQLKENTAMIEELKERIAVLEALVAELKSKKTLGLPKRDR